MTSAVGRLHPVEISSPVLKSSTSDRVSPQLNRFPYGNNEPVGVRDANVSLQHANDTNNSTRFAGIHVSNSPRNVPTPPPPELITNQGDMPMMVEDIDTNSQSGSSTVSSSKVQSVGSPGFVVPVSEGISDDDINQVEMFYRSQQTQVVVCGSLTNMYLSAPIHHQQTPSATDIAKDDWDFSQTGIPVIVLNTGEHRRGRSLRLVLAEKGTGFTLWQDDVLPQTQYNTPHTNFHTVTISTDITRLVGFSFDEADAATEFAEAFRSMMENTDNDSANTCKKKQKKKKEKKSKFKPPKKIDISQPCCFVHVTKLERPDLIGGMFPPPPSGAELSRLGIPRAASESSEMSEGSTNPSEH